MGQTSEPDYTFLLTAIQQLKDLNKVIDVTSNDLLENINLTDKTDTDKNIRKIYNRLEITCKLGSDKIEEILQKLRTDFNNYTQNLEKEKAIQKAKPVAMVTLPNSDDGSETLIEMIESETTTSNSVENVATNNKSNSDGNNTNDENSNEAKVNADGDDNKVKLKLVAIEKLMDPKLLSNKPNKSISVEKNNSNSKKTRLKNASSDDDFVPISVRKPLRTSKKLMDLSIICLDDTTDESSSNSDIIVVTSKKSKSESNKSKASVKNESLNDEENVNDLLAKCKPVKVKINKLPKNLEKLMKLYGVTEIKNNRNKVIAKLTDDTEKPTILGETTKKRGRSSSVNSSLSNSSKQSTRKRNRLDKSKNSSDSNKDTELEDKVKSNNSLKKDKNKTDGTRKNKTLNENRTSDSKSDEHGSKSETGKNKKLTKDNGIIDNGFASNCERDSHDETINSSSSDKSLNSREKNKTQPSDKSKITLEKTSEKSLQNNDDKSESNIDDGEEDSEIITNGINKEPNNNDSVDNDNHKKEQNDNDSMKHKSSSSGEEGTDKEINEASKNSDSSNNDNDSKITRKSPRKSTTKASKFTAYEFKKSSRVCRSASKSNNSQTMETTKADENMNDDNEDEKQSENSNSKDTSKTCDQDSSDSDCFQPKTKKRKSTKEPANDSDNNSENDEDNEKPTKRKRIKTLKSDSSEEDDDGNGNKGRKNIRKLLKIKDLEYQTKQAAKTELERKRRIEERQRMYNKIYEDQMEKVKVIDSLVLDFDEETKEDLLTVDKQLIKKLKPHQASGVKFMWDACFETIKQSADGSGSGCILAHCMGLGKSLQIVTLAHTLLTHSDRTNVQRVLVIAPLSTVLNWVNEFRKWLAFCETNKDMEIYEISKYKKNIERAFKLQEWHDEGGIMILGYDMFRNLVSETGSKIRKKTREQIQTSLIDPGPDMVVCDEGHLLKNEKTTLSKSVNRIKTLRRIVLTGTPLQNNLKEYYCMVQFVKPNLLGKFTEYMNRFVNPITNGQYTDSTPADIQLMKKRSHVLHKMLDGCVQRRDYSVLAPFLPPKHEYVVFVQLTELQVKLYKYYMENKSGRIDPTQKRSSILFADFQNLQRIWTHPRILRYNSDKYEQVQQKKRDEESEDDFIADNTSEESATSSSSSESSDSDNSEKDQTYNKKPTGGRKTRGNADQYESEPENRIESKIENPTEWWTSMVTDKDLDSLRNSGKLMLLFSILKECESVGDKLLVFSQSLYSLDIIEHFLKIIHEKRNNKTVNEDDDTCGYKGSWKLGQDYFRLDGSTSIENRNASCKIFNNSNNTIARLFLISTRAGGLGINLVSANRVVIFDVSWNPSHDIQSIFRVYRFGQIKPCYIYRFIALGSMEEKIYERQVTKLAISKRVIDEQQIDRHYKENDLMELYRYEIVPEESRPTPLVPKDRLFADLLKKNEKFIFKYHEHDSLLENKVEETLNEEERKTAWEEFEAEKNRPQYTYTQPRVTGPVTSNFIFGFRIDILLRLLNIKARKDNPLFADHEIRQMVPLLLQKLHSQMEIGDASMYKDLVNLQNELEIPSANYTPMINQLGMSSGMPNAFTNQGMGLSGTTPFLNPFASNAPSVLQLRAQHQQLEQYALEQQQKMLQEQAKARLLDLERNIAASSMPSEVIDLD